MAIRSSNSLLGHRTRMLTTHSLPPQLTTTVLQGEKLFLVDITEGRFEKSLQRLKTPPAPGPVG